MICPELMKMISLMRRRGHISLRMIGMITPINKPMLSIIGRSWDSHTKVTRRVLFRLLVNLINAIQWSRVSHLSSLATKWTRRKEHDFLIKMGPV